MLSLLNLAFRVLTYENSVCAFQAWKMFRQKNLIKCLSKVKENFLAQMHSALLFLNTLERIFQGRRLDYSKVSLGKFLFSPNGTMKARDIPEIVDIVFINEGRKEARQHFRAKEWKD